MAKIRLNKEQKAIKDEIVSKYMEGEEVFDQENVERLLREALDNREHLWADVRQLDAEIVAYKEVLEALGEERIYSEDDLYKDAPTMDEVLRRL